MESIPTGISECQHLHYYTKTAAQNNMRRLCDDNQKIKNAVCCLLLEKNDLQTVNYLTVNYKLPSHRPNQTSTSSLLSSLLSQQKQSYNTLNSLTCITYSKVHRQTKKKLQILILYKTTCDHSLHFTSSNISFCRHNNYIYVS